jgi:hypothetical protein
MLPLSSAFHPLPNERNRVERDTEIALSGPSGILGINLLFELPSNLFEMGNA